MTHYNTSSSDVNSDSTGWLSVREHAAGGPRIVAMDKRDTQHQEAYYLFFVASVGMALNLLVITMIFVRRNLRRMTSAFLIHAGFLNLVKAAFCIPFGLNLLSGADGTDTNQPPDCTLQGSAYIVIVTTSAINMVAMICTEAYTFGEVNVGGNSHGTSCCIIFGLIVVYITSVILHLGPTLIGGDIVYNPDIGNCAFKLGSVTGYVANIMWIVIITISFVGVGHFLNKLYKEIQMNRPNRVSMLVRHSITITDELGRKPSACTVHEMTQEAMHRAKIFVITAVAFALCWYPLFLLILIDINFRVSPKVYQAFSFIAWTEAMVEPIILICFDRNLNLLARFMYCDREHYTASQIAFLMAQSRQQQQLQHQHDDEAITSLHNSIEAGDAFHGHGGASGGCAHSMANVSQESTSHAFAAPIPCRHCHPGGTPGETTPLRPTAQYRPHSRSSDTPVTSSTNELRRVGDFGDESFEMNFTPLHVEYNPVRQKEIDAEDEERQDDVQC